MFLKEYIYTNSKDKRVRLVIVDNNGKHTSRSYPRVLMEKELGRPLLKTEDVHHKDGNPLNNDIDNLEIIDHRIHVKGHALKYKELDTEEICCVCGCKFTKTRTSWLETFSVRKNGSFVWLTCSRSCRGKIGSGKYVPLYDVNSRIDEVYKLFTGMT